MPTQPIIEYPDPRLLATSEVVRDFDDSLQQLVVNLTDTLNDNTGIGLSAPQINDLRRVLITDFSARQSPPEVYINPEVIHSAMPGIVEETCLSVPDVTVQVIRSTQIRVRANDPLGNEFERDLSGMHAVCLQHEIDHLDGKLLIDRVSIFRRWWVRNRLIKRAAGKAA